MRWAAWCLILPALLLLPAAAQSGKNPVVAKWGRFDQTFHSSVVYSNALQDATLTVIFSSPLGETNLVYGFWDGGRTWRVRFSPDQPGRWTYRTICSDAANHGLHQQVGSFTCTAAIGVTPFHVHGPVRVARDHRHLEYADGTPFFWLADTVWDGARAAQPRDWEVYAVARSLEHFTVAQWSVAPGQDERGASATAGFVDRIHINPEFFQRLDAKLDTLSHAGLLSAVVPFAELNPLADPGMAVPDDQLALLLRYVVARWGAEPVVWLLAFDSSEPAKAVARWKRIGHAVFAEIRHAPVMVYAGHLPASRDAFRDQPWVDLFALPTVTDISVDALKAFWAGPFSTEWTKEPARPLIPFLLYENAPMAQSGSRFAADDLRRLAYWSLLATPPAGVSYGAQGVVNWDTSEPPPSERGKEGDQPLWRRSLFLPGAKEMGLLADFMNTTDFWRLRPQPKAVLNQPGNASPERWIVAETTEAKNRTLAYVPQDRAVDLSLDALPPAPLATWFNPRTGETIRANAVPGSNGCQFPTPGPGDWLLSLKAGD